MTDTTIKKLVTYEDPLTQEQKILTDNGTPVTTNINLEEASVQIANATTEITPSSQYDGLSKVTATIPIRTNLSGTGVNDTITIPNISTTGIILNQNSGNGILNITTQATPVFKAQDFVVYNNLSGINGTSKSQTLNVNLQDYLIDNPNTITQNGSNINVTNYKTIKVQVEGTGSDVSGVTATAPDVANSKVFVNSDGQSVTGSMNLTDLTITPSTTQQTWDNYNAQGNYTCYKKIICNPIAITRYNKTFTLADNSQKTADISYSSAISKTLKMLLIFPDTISNIPAGSGYPFVASGYFYDSSGLSLNSTYKMYEVWSVASYSSAKTYLSFDYEYGTDAAVTLTIGNSYQSMSLTSIYGFFPQKIRVVYFFI